ncbi:hypothetical protein B0T17DRAFT_367137 [Bombardia bombarda]|uniref:Uncharacterized protein n=1 Tax=Bombardia bombarda TaxID=252184 RepID=A0AA40BWB1_9PEZI|nr:hypothetical protein B0T17DRAFT_367137 [Bombardia bombarda]
MGLNTDVHQMLFHRMAFKPYLCLILWTTLSTVVSATPLSISDEILDFVPSCAQTCFRSYIAADFADSSCGDSPSLQCLCTQTGSSGYTLGEGAFYCVVASKADLKLGYCQGDDTDLQTQQIAYHMCDSIAGAALETHSTIVATLIVPSETGSRSGPVVATSTPASTSGRGTSARSTIASSTTTKSSSSSKTIARSSTTTEATTSGTTSMPTIALPPDATSTAAPTQSPIPSSSPSQLTSAQTTGIAVGCTAVVLIGIGLVFLARCVRRRRFRDAESGFNKMSDTWSFGRKSAPHSPSTAMFQISHPIRKATVDMDFRRSGDQMQQTQSDGLMGLAISTNSAELPVSNPRTAAPGNYKPLPPINPLPTINITPPSRSQTPKRDRSPPKPTLTLAIPKAPVPVPVPTVRAQPNRDSVATEFAEDGEGEASTAAAGSGIWRPPPTDPQSATTYYFADKGGNWVLRNKSDQNVETAKVATTPNRKQETIRVVKKSPEVELPSPDDKTKAERAQEMYVAPLRIPRKPSQAKLGSPIAFKGQQREASTSKAGTTGLGLSAPAKVAQPDSYFAMIRDGREVVASKSRRRASKRTSRRRSQDSATSIESAAAGPFEEEDTIDDEPQMDLSPVAESPRTPAKSTVSYPKIHNRSEGQRQAPSKPPGAYMFPPPPRRYSLNPQGQPSPTLGSLDTPIVPVTDMRPPTVTQMGDSSRPMNPSNLNPNPNRNPGQLRTGSPETRAVGWVPQVPPGQQRNKRQETQTPAEYWDQSVAQPERQRQQPTQTEERQWPPQPIPAQYPRATEPNSRYQLWRPPQQGQEQEQRRPPPQQGQPQYVQPRYRPTSQYAQLQQAAPPPRQQQQRQQQRQQPQRQYMQPPQQYPEQPQYRQPQYQPTPQGAGNSQGTLLAKRLGADRAAALAPLGGGGGDAPQKARNNAWTRESRGYAPQNQAQGSFQGQGPVPGARRPPIVAGRYVNANAAQQEPMPPTPGWAPELMPTRRGDDLFLNVQ